LFELVEHAWASSQASASLIRYITLPDVGECLLYSTQVDMGLILSMIFNAATSVRTIRRQARRLSESLELVPEETDSPAAETLPSRPTDLVRPKGWDEAVQKLEALTSNERGADASIPVRPEREKDVVYTAYTCLWLPADPTLELLDDLAEGLAVWIEDIAAENAWNVDDLTIFPDYVLVSLRAPEDILPDDAIMHLMDETARLSEDYFPEATNDGPFWTDGYYMVSPPRDLSDREIARFITYQRQAQLG
ncbi:MAG: transposase, partial [Anaerolineae bacterium]|nr:transposase [Anaerolineae bacterium]